MRKTVLLSLIIIPLVCSCGNQLSSRETADQIISLICNNDFDSLTIKAPFLSQLPKDEQKTIQEALSPFMKKGYSLQIRRQGFNTETLFLTPYEPGLKSLIMTMKKSQGEWILKENISFKQTIGFIPKE
jgi:hypothetical protein